MKMDEDESKDKCLYFIEDKNEDELFEVLELEEDDMENVEVSNENNEPNHEETLQANVDVKCPTTTSKLRTCVKPSGIFNFNFHFVKEKEFRLTSKAATLMN